MTFRNKILLEVLLVSALTAVTTVILVELGIGDVIGSVVALWALFYLLVFGFLMAEA